VSKDAGEKVDIIRQLMGAAHVFSSAVDDLLDRTLSEASRGTLAMSQVKLLLLIARPGQRYKVMDVAEFLGVTNAAASRAIDRLVQRGLVDRTISREDRRAVDLALTEESRRLLDRFEEARNAELMRLLADYPEERLQAVIALLDELSVNLLQGEGAEGEKCLRCGVHFRTTCLLRSVFGRECSVMNGGRQDDGRPPLAAEG
jgi:DNA-binding MarR family transcriptional regulator